MQNCIKLVLLFCWLLTYRHGIGTIAGLGIGVQPNIISGTCGQIVEQDRGGGGIQGHVGQNFHGVASSYLCNKPKINKFKIAAEQKININIKLAELRASFLKCLQQYCLMNIISIKCMQFY